MTKRPSAAFIYFLAAFAGAAVMIVEISSSRLLAPFFGTSLFVWTNIIAGVMIALAAGYYLGGRLADNRPEISFLCKILFVSGLIFLVIPEVVRYISSAASSNPATGIYFPAGLAFAGSILVLALPLMLLGMVPPFLTKVMSETREVGRSAGSISALSTFGSVVGTYLPAVWLIPTFGTKATIHSVAWGLVIFGAVGFWPVKKICWWRYC
ncbi:MAG: fused MFS/spermidine synthase [Patescibacteria group bacterium]|nr:fused MFS/spermidine synthase [Patescibacteria group bacterium]